MDRIIWTERPRLREPAMLAAFDGWGDAGSASTLAVRYLMEAGEAVMFAAIDGEEYLDYQVQRPLIELDELGIRSVTWPAIEFYAMETPPAQRDLVVVVGPEPNVRWKAFINDVMTVIEEAAVREAVTLGAFAGQVPHTLPVPLVGSGPDRDAIERHQLFPSGYEGPTGIVGVLNEALFAAQIPTMSIWAAVPHYLSAQDYPPAAVALAEKVLEVLDLPLDLGLARHESDQFRSQVDEALDDPELRSYVEELEAESADPLDGESGSQLVEEIERFLRGG